MELSSNDYERLHNFYNRALVNYGSYDARSVQWSSQYNQQTRFNVLTAVAHMSDKSILDFGCGLGDLYKHFLHNKIQVSYTGIDIVPEFIGAAKTRFPEARFILEDVFALNESFDYVIASGALSFKVENYKSYYFEVIKKLYSLSREGLAFNMLQKDRHIDDDRFATYSPDEVLEFCKTLSDAVEIVTDYLPDDFTVYVRKLR